MGRGVILSRLKGLRGDSPQRVAARALLSPLLKNVRVDERWETSIREEMKGKTVVYVLRNLSVLDFLALDTLTRARKLPGIGFAQDMPGWLGVASPGGEDIAATLSENTSTVLFLKRAPGWLAQVRRGRKEGDAILQELIALQRSGKRKIVLIPQVFVWTRRPEAVGQRWADVLLGTVDFPGDLRALSQFALNFNNGVLRSGEPIDLGDYLASAGDGDGTEVLVRRLTYALMRKVERERRAIVGPMAKPADRVREEVLRTPALQKAIAELAGPGQPQRQLLIDKARRMLSQMQATPDNEAIAAMEIAVQWTVDHMFESMDVDEEGMARVRDAVQRGPVILLPNHRSHLDYILLTYVMRKNALAPPMIAAGDNLSFFPMGLVFRSGGAFFIRRAFQGDRLYVAVVDAYLRRLIRDGYAIEFFLEGGRSRTGKMLPPKTGLLSMVIDAALALEGKSLSIIPVSVGYERTLEEKSYARERLGEKKNKEGAVAMLRNAARLTEKYGRANLQFGKVIEFSDVRSRWPADLPVGAERRALLLKLAHEVLFEINRVTQVSPGAIVAVVLLSHPGRGLAHADLLAEGERLTRLLQQLGARISRDLAPGGVFRSEAIRDAALMYVRSGVVEQQVPGTTLAPKAKKRARIYTGPAVVYVVPSDKRLILDLAKNSIIHFFVDRSLVAVAFLSAVSDGRAAWADVAGRVQQLSRLFKFEFMFRTDAPFEANLRKTVAALEEGGDLQLRASWVQRGPANDADHHLRLYADMLRNFLEAYRIAARACAVWARAPIATKDLVAKTITLGERMFLEGDIQRAEAIGAPLFENALRAFEDQGYLSRSGGKVRLADSFSAPETAAAIEAKIVSLCFVSGP